jgi:uncharacterized protein (TIGR02996 family)
MAKRRTLTEEDRFIKSIAAAPDDAALRLVYADWLEDHGQPARSAYLRAEVEFFRPSKRKKKLKGAWERAKEFDPVWAAMISRLPHGILRPGLTFSEGGPSLCRDHLKSLEEHWGASLPADYAAFLLLYNGGRPSLPYLGVWDAGPEDPGEDYEPGQYYSEVYLYSLGEKDETGALAHWTSAADMCAEDRSSNGGEDYLRLMLIGTLTYPHGCSWVNRLFLDVDADSYCAYVQLYFDDEGKNLIPWEEQVLFPHTVIDLLGDLER